MIERARTGYVVATKLKCLCLRKVDMSYGLTIYTLIETAKLNEVDAHAWLADVLKRLPDHPAQRLHELLPWNWKTSQVRPAAA
jgi:transposase